MACFGMTVSFIPLGMFAHCAIGGKCMRKIMKEKSLAKLAPYGQTNKSPFLNDPPPKEAAPRNKKKIDDWYATHETNIREEIHFSHSSQLLHKSTCWLHHLFSASYDRPNHGCDDGGSSSPTRSAYWSHGKFRPLLRPR